MNVIIVMSDSFRRDHVGAFGNDWVRTPSLDRFAAESCVFPLFQMGSFATIPQRTDMFTGRFSFAERPWQPLEPDDVVLTEILAGDGVATYCAADTPHLFRSAQLTFMRGFEGFHWSRGSESDIWWTDYYAEQDYRPPTGKGEIRFSSRDEGRQFRRILSQGLRRVRELDWVTPQTFNAAIEWLTHNYRRESFFLYVDTFDPHEPWDPPRWLADLYGADPDRVPYAWAEYGSTDRFGEEELQQLRALYAGECTMVDRWFGRLVETVDLLGLADETMIMFLSDHGHYLGYPNDGGQIGKAAGYHREGGDGRTYMPLLDPISNPVLIVRAPGSEPGASIEQLVQPCDIMPTVLELMSLEVPDTVQARSFLPLLQGEEAQIRDNALTAAHNNFAQVTDGRWIYGAPRYDCPPKLIDRGAETVGDSLRDHPDIAGELHRALIDGMRSLGAPDEWIADLDAKKAKIGQ